jgi:hypothetical protein
MKKINIISGFIVVALVSFFSCKRDMALIDKTASPAGTARISIIDVSPNLGSILNTNADTFNILFNGVKITGYTPSAAASVTYNSIYPFAGNNNGYASVPAGDQEVKFVKGFNTLDSVVLMPAFHKTLLADQYYSLIITDSIGSGRDSSKIFVKDSLLPVTAGYYNLRFVHAVLNDTAGKGIDVWSTRNNRTIFSNIKPGTVTAFSSYAYNAVLNDTLFVRRAGTLAGLDTLNTVIYNNQRSYTLVYKGNGNSNKNTDTKRRHLITYFNQ